MAIPNHYPPYTYFFNVFYSLKYNKQAVTETSEMLIHKQQHVEILKIQKYPDALIYCVKISLSTDLLLKML